MALEERIERESPEQGEILRGVIPIEREITNGKDVFIYRLRDFPKVKGILFSNNDIVEMGIPYDVVVNKVLRKTSCTLYLPGT
mgnify:CR=1 FL=1